MQATFWSNLEAYSQCGTDASLETGWETGEVEPIAQGEDHEQSMAGALAKSAFKFKLKGKKLGSVLIVEMD